MKLLDDLLEIVALDKPHRIIRPAAGVGAQPVYGDDPWMLEIARDLGLQQEPLAANPVVGMSLEDLLERDLSIELAIEGDKDDAQAPFGMRAKDLKPLTVGRGRAHRDRGGAPGIAVRLGVAQAAGDVAESGLKIGIGEACQGMMHGSTGGDGSQAPFRLAAMLFQVPLDQSLDSRAILCIETAALDKLVGQQPALGTGPGLEARDELALVDQAVLQSEQSKQQVAVEWRWRPWGRNS